MNVQDLLDRKDRRVVTVGPDDTVLDAAAKMNAAQIGAVVVFEPLRGVVGIFSERDILKRVVGQCQSPDSTRVGNVMSHPVTCCKPSSSIEECKDVMTRRRVRHLPVVEDGRLVGMISSGDIMAHEAELQQSTIEYLHEYLHGRA